VFEFPKSQFGFSIYNFRKIDYQKLDDRALNREVGGGAIIISKTKVELK